MGGGLEEEIVIMLDAHYNGSINIADYWAVGDVRTENITAISSGTTGESQSAQSVDLVIIGIKHDNKADGTGKSAITVQTKSQLGTVGYINSSHTSPTYSLWSTSQRRTWCNNKFKTSLPTWLQNLVKPVKKVTNRYCHSSYSGYESYRDQTSTTDDVFLLSEFETFGSAQYDSEYYGNVGSDGTQYEYMKTQANRIKKGPESYWFLRTCVMNGNGYATFYMVYCYNGTISGGFASSVYGIAPAFCL